MTVEQNIGVVIVESDAKRPVSDHLHHLVQSMNEQYGDGVVDPSGSPVAQLEQVISLKYDLVIEEALHTGRGLHILKFHTIRGDRNELSRALKEFERMVRSLLRIRIKSFLISEASLAQFDD